MVEEYEIRRSFMEEVLSKNNFPNPKACYNEWTAMGVLDRDKDRPTRSRKIDKASDKSEDVFVLRVFGTTLAAPPTKPKSKLIQRPASQINALLDTNDEEEEENDRTA